MGSRLRTIRKFAKLGGKGKRTEALIRKLAKYYGLAIRRNSESVEEMQKAIMATFFHAISTNKKPLHQNCSTGFDSWCKWHIAEAACDIQQNRCTVCKENGKRKETRYFCQKRNAALCVTPCFQLYHVESK
ncbi:hypothetical protein WN55_07329 [Dufourea novaeangliae]|uniref:Mutator-like transposase domain-containing protein n=1 Tax=Dufourea novaeangliae TaxID=178035 RepID=A0A154PTL8_DUFNO|nr:hypothetical protein WN55_07329 [Dufourea novaeangliae]